MPEGTQNARDETHGQVTGGVGGGKQAATTVHENERSVNKEVSTRRNQEKSIKDKDKISQDSKKELGKALTPHREQGGEGQRHHRTVEDGARETCPNSWRIHDPLRSGRRGSWILSS